MSFGRSFALHSKRAPLCRLEIRTDTDYIMYRGRPGATEPQKLKGRVVLMNTETIDAKCVKITLEGKRRTSHVITAEEAEAGMNLFPNPIKTKQDFYREERQLAPSPSKISPSNHEFAFEFDLPGDACESIEGFSSTVPLFQIYRLHALIERRFGVKDLVETKHIRVVRTISRSPEELLDPESISGTWADKIMYEWSIATKSLIYGDKVTVDFNLTPLADKLRIGKIKFFIREKVQIKTDPGLQYYPSYGFGNMWEEVHEAGETVVDPPDHVPETLHPELLLPQKVFSLIFDLPKSLKECRQSVDYGEWIFIRHRLHINMLLHNADGHLSELKAHMPIRLYISPELPIGNDNTVSTPTVNLSSSNLRAEATAMPPAYENHTHDQPLNPFRDINPSGFVTPAITSRSGSSTPRHPNYSRNASAEQVPGLSNSSDHHTPLPLDLEARLENLQTLSRSQEEAESAQIVQHVDLNLSDLERITSYNTAVRNPGPARYSNLPPTYADATSKITRPEVVAAAYAHIRNDNGPAVSSEPTSASASRSGSQG